MVADRSSFSEPHRWRHGIRLIAALALLGLALALAMGLFPEVAIGRPEGAPRALVWCPSEAPLSRAHPLPVVRLGQVELVEVDAGAGDLVEGARIADPHPWGEPTYLVTGPAEAIQPQALSWVSRGPGDWWLVRGSRTAIEELAVRGMSLVRLDPPRAGELRPLPPPPPPQFASPGFDPRIAAIALQLDRAQVTATVERLQAFGTRHSSTDSCAAAASYLYGRFADMGLATAFDVFDLNGTLVSNVIATQPGSASADEVYILCGHYDSTSNQPYTDAPGADDNGSGSAAVVEAARVLSQHHFESTIRYVCFGGEEQGLVGSKHYVENVVIPEGVNVRAVINLDMVGYVHPEYSDWDANYYVDENVSFGLGQHLARCVIDYSTCTPHLIATELPQWGSDHFWFAEYGYPATLGIDAQLWGAPDWNPHYHSPADRVETLDLIYLTEFARGATAAVAELAVLEDVVAAQDPTGVGSVVPLVVAAPNPASSSIRFDLRGDSGAPLVVAISDATGRRIAVLRGVGLVTWNGRDASGRPAPSGNYYYRVTGGSVDAGGRLTLIR